MKIALINEKSQANKNSLIYKVLQKVANDNNHQVFNYGMSDDKENYEINYIEAGLLAGILLGCDCVDFVVLGCGTGQGAMLSANSFPFVNCGLVTDALDAQLFSKINAGNAVSIPFAKGFGWGSELELESIFRNLFTEEMGLGYPKSKKEHQEAQRKQLKQLKECNGVALYDFIDQIDKDMLYNTIHNDYFEEKFFEYSKDDEISSYLKEVIDAKIS